MYKISYMGNGTTTEFSFNFPYFENSNVVVTKNGVPATGYNIVGVSGGTDADIPFTGGMVVFDAAPSSLDSIIITRKLPLSRIADYQPTTHVKTTTLNQDLNYLTELLKDRANEMESLYEKYAEIADKESTEIILARMDAMQQEILALGNVSAIRDNITSLNTQAADIPNKLNKTLDNIPAISKQTITSLCMPDYDRQIVGSLTAANTYISCQYNSFVILWSSAAYQENYSALLKTPNGTIVCVGRRMDDQDAFTQTSSFTFPCPAGCSFTCQAPNGFDYRIIPLKGHF